MKKTDMTEKKKECEIFLIRYIGVQFFFTRKLNNAEL